jgi:hypothetical protein
MGLPLIEACVGRGHPDRGSGAALYVPLYAFRRAVRSIVRARARDRKRRRHASMLTSTHIDEAAPHRHGDKGRERRRQACAKIGQGRVLTDFRAS